MLLIPQGWSSWSTGRVIKASSLGVRAPPGTHASVLQQEGQREILKSEVRIPPSIGAFNTKGGNKTTCGGRHAKASRLNGNQKRHPARRTTETRAMGLRAWTAYARLPPLLLEYMPPPPLSIYLCITTANIGVDHSRSRVVNG